MSKYSVFKDSVHKVVEGVRITEYIDITAELKKQHNNFIGKEKIFVQVTVEKDDSTDYLVELFNEKKPGKDGRIKEGSRISFLDSNNFPDGCYYTVKKGRSEIDCYICELKHTPGHKLGIIAKQFYVAYMHCKTIFAAVKLDEHYTIRYHFEIYGFNERYEAFDMQPIVNGVVKTPPGVRPAFLHELKAYERYKKGEIYFSYTTDFSEADPFIFQVKYIQLVFDQNPIESNLVCLVHESSV